MLYAAVSVSMCLNFKKEHDHKKKKNWQTKKNHDGAVDEIGRQSTVCSRSSVYLYISMHFLPLTACDVLDEKPQNIIAGCVEG